MTLPAAISEVKAVQGFRNPQWQARALQPAERVGTQQALVAIEARCRPATSQQIMWHVGKLLSHWDSNQGALVKDQIMEDWKLDLGEESEAHIAEACAQWRRSQKFKPKVAEILELIAGIKARDSESIRRARVLLGLEPPRNWERPALPTPTEVDRPAARSMLAALTERMTGRKPTAPKDDQRRTAADVRRELAEQRGEGGRQLAENFRRATGSEG